MGNDTADFPRYSDAYTARYAHTVIDLQRVGTQGASLVSFERPAGRIRWRYQAPAPVLGAVTPTAGGVVFSADMAGNAYAFDAEDGKLLWSVALDGAAGGGVITYAVGGAQRVAFVAGTSSPSWPVPKKTAKIVVFGLP